MVVVPHKGRDAVNRGGLRSPKNSTDKTSETLRNLVANRRKPRRVRKLKLKGFCNARGQLLSPANAAESPARRTARAGTTRRRPAPAGAARGRADAVAGVVVDAEQDRLAARRGGLQAGGRLGRLPRLDARVVDAVRQQHGGILRAVLDVVVACSSPAGRGTRLVLGRVPNSGMLGGPFIVVSKRSMSVQPTEICAAAKRSGRSVIARPMRMPPALPPCAGQLRGRGVAGLHQILGAGDEVLPGVGLGRFAPGVVPLLAERAAAADVGDGEHAAPLEPGEARWDRKRIAAVKP